VEHLLAMTVRRPSHVVGTMSNSSDGVRGGVVAGERPASLPGREGRRLPDARFLPSGRKGAPISTGMIRDVTGRRRGSDFGRRHAGALKGDRSSRAREAPRAILHREVGTTQPDDQPASRTMHYQHGICRDAGHPGPTMIKFKRLPQRPAEEHKRA
jgi:hypothetical protein